MTWQDVKDSLNELPDDVIATLSGEVRSTLNLTARDPGLNNMAVDHGRSAGSSAAWRTPSGADDRRVQQYIVAYRDLQLGWNIARECYHRRLPLPSALAWNCEPVFRAYLYLLNPKKYYDQHLLEAISWQTPAMSGVAVKIKACLVARGATVADVAAALNVSEESLRVYDELFFNITGRKEDALWLSNIVYPNSRMVEFYEDYSTRADLDKLLMRAGFKNGLEHVLQLAGISADPLDMLESSVSAQQLESFLMAQGLLMAQNGWVNNTANAAAIFHARHLLTAAKMGGEDTSQGSEYLGLGDTLWSEMQNVKKPQAEAALRLQNAHRHAIDVEAVEEID
jgi:hypothetical protein